MEARIKHLNHILESIKKEDITKNEEIIEEDDISIANLLLIIVVLVALVYVLFKLYSPKKKKNI